MSSEEAPQLDEKPKTESQDAQMQDATSPTDAAASTRKRPRLDLATDARDRKRGKTMFGLLRTTLEKAKHEDSQRNNSEAARKRQLIEQRLQDKLRKETDSVRRAEEVKKDKLSANRKEEELQLKDSIHKYRRTRLPLFANFLSTADQIPRDGSSPSSSDPLAPVPRSHPPPLYYLPAVLLPEQEAFINRRKAEVKEAAEKEWETFKSERAAGVEEISRLRQRAAEEEERKKQERKEAAAAGKAGEPEQDVKMEDSGAAKDEPASSTPAASDVKNEPEAAPQMEVDEAKPSAEPKEEAKPEALKSPSPRKEETPAAATLIQAAAGDEDDAVEY